jgi:hypothetical protein
MHNTTQGLQKTNKEEAYFWQFSAHRSDRMDGPFSQEARRAAKPSVKNETMQRRSALKSCAATATLPAIAQQSVALLSTENPLQPLVFPRSSVTNPPV